MGETYEGYLTTGSGSDTVRLELGPDTARIVLGSRWMFVDDVPERCELRFAHRPIDERHGLLELTGASAAERDGEPEPLPDLSDEDALLPVIVEYLRVPSTAVHMHRNSQLATMRPLGYAEWNERFDLLLLTDDREGWPEHPPWEHIRYRLDKMKLARVDD